MAAPKDRVQLRKSEEASRGGDAADDNMGMPALLNANEDAPEVRGVFLQTDVSNDEEVYVTRDGDDMLFRDVANPAEKTLTELLAGAGGLTESAHRALRQLIHFIDDGPAEGFVSGAFKETTGTIYPSLEAWYVVGSTPPAGLIVSLATTWSGVKITQEIWKMYDTDGSTVLVTVTDAISYSGVFETSRTRTIV
jgi:hypothetical protein